jgi:hypothetical protein
MLSAATAQFIGQNLHFAVDLFVALACFAAGWLYLDAGSKHHLFVKTSKWAGFFLLALGFLVAGASGADSGALSTLGIIFKLLGYSGILISNFFDPIQARPHTMGITNLLTQLIAKRNQPAPSAPARTPAVAPSPPSSPASASTPAATPTAAFAPNPAALAPTTKVAVSVQPSTTPATLNQSPATPSTSPPATTSPKPASPTSPTAPSPAPVNGPAQSTSSSPSSTAPSSAKPPQPPAGSTPPLAVFGIPAVVTTSLGILLPLGSGLISVLYWRRATTGLERHIKGVAWAFTGFTLADILALLIHTWSTSDNPLLQSFAQPLSSLWTIQHITLLVSGILLTRWVWRYLTRRPQTQLFLLATSIMVTVVLTTTITMTSLLLASIEKDALTSLETSAKVLGYAVDGKTSDTRADARILAQTPAVIQAVSANDHTSLARLADSLLDDKNLTDFIATDRTGQVLIRASDPDLYGDAMSGNSLITRALAGTTVSSIMSQSGAVAPTLAVSTATPIKQANGAIIGAILGVQALDNAFVDGIKRTTGLDSTVYHDTTRTATTLVAPDGTSRYIGAKETSPAVINTTLGQGKPWHGSLTISNQPFLVTYLPLKDADNTVVGMLSVGKSQHAILETSTQAVRLTFLSAIIWLIVIMLPIYLVSRHIARQLH